MLNFQFSSESCLSLKLPVHAQVVLRRIEIAKHRRFETFPAQLRFENNFRVRVFDQTLYAQLTAHQPALNFGQQCSPYSQAEWKMGPNLASQQRTFRMLGCLSKVGQEIFC